MMPNNDRLRPLPSTFQQVVENMEKIQNEILPIIEIIKNTILANLLDPDKPMDVDGKNDVVYDPTDEVMRVVGVTIIIEHKDEDLRPDQYSHDVTWELKNAEVVGLNGKDGVNHEYITLRTVRMNRDTGADCPDWQCAFGDNMEMYWREAVSETEWGPWIRVIDLKRILEQDPEVFKTYLQEILKKYPDILKEYMIEFLKNYPDVFQEIIDMASHKQFVESVTEPEDQDLGDYWFQPMDAEEPDPNPPEPTSDYALQYIDTEEIEVLDAETRKNYVTQDIDSTEINPGGDYDIEAAKLDL